MSETCGTCAHWQRPEHRTGYGNAIRFEWNAGDDLEAREDTADRLFGECQAVVEGWDLSPAEPLPLAVVRDGSDYVASMFTQAAFGCALYAANRPLPPKREGAELVALDQAT